LVGGFIVPYFKIAAGAVVATIVGIWVWNSQQTKRDESVRANIMQNWVRCSTQIQRQLVDSDQQGSVDDLLKIVLSECRVRYRAYLENVWEWREDALTEAVKKQITRAKEVRAAGGSEKARKAELIEAAIEQLYGLGVTLEDLQNYLCGADSQNGKSK
jgi:hypothetical protein